MITELLILSGIILVLGFIVEVNEFRDTYSLEIERNGWINTIRQVWGKDK